MEMKGFTNMEEFERIMSNWAAATGLAAVAVDNDGKYISRQYNFTEFCSKLTRGSKEGCARCERCDREGQGIYNCHAGLIEFRIPLAVDGETVGYAIGGQILPKNPDEEKFRKVAREIGVDEDQYINALQKVNARTEAVIRASSELLGAALNNFINAEYSKNRSGKFIDRLSASVDTTHEMVEQITQKTAELRSLQNRQNILALNASIEAARAGEKGAGFAVVAKEVRNLSEQSARVNMDIEEVVKSISQAVESMRL